MNLYLLRHGETDWNAEGRLQGHADIHLNLNGKKQMEQAAEDLKKLGVEIDLIITSPLARAKESGEIIAEQLAYEKEKILVEPLLIERCFGEGEGKIWAELVAKYPEGIQAGYEPFEGVELLEELVKRGQKAFDRILSTYADKQNVVIVAHGAILSAMLTAITNGEIEYGGRKITQGSIYMINCANGVIEVEGESGAK